MATAVLNDIFNAFGHRLVQVVDCVQRNALPSCLNALPKLTPCSRPFLLIFASQWTTDFQLVKDLAIQGEYGAV